MIIRAATSDADLAEVRGLFREYADWLAVDLCFQGFAEELAGLPGLYQPPRGRLLIAEHENRACGCVALRPLEGEICEMKRLYVRPECRGSGVGRRLVLAIMAEARAIGYQRIRLDALPKMDAAQALYQSLGFRPIESYYENPVPGARFLEADL
jgi:ribosomal protein S18 acetylase RimI-like enzyme